MLRLYKQNIDYLTIRNINASSKFDFILMNERQGGAISQKNCSLLGF